MVSAPKNADSMLTYTLSFASTKDGLGQVAYGSTQGSTPPSGAEEWMFSFHNDALSKSASERRTPAR